MTQQQARWRTILDSAGPYPLEAFGFVRDGLSYTSKRVHQADSGLHELERHISGQQLCMGLRDYAIDQYGALAPVVLEHWCIHRTEDFGRIVFAMIDAELMSSTPGDSLEDFRAVYEFGEAFNHGDLLERIGLD